MVWYDVCYGTVWYSMALYGWLHVDGGAFAESLPDVTGRASEPPSIHLFSVKLFFNALLIVSAIY